MRDAEHSARQRAFYDVGRHAHLRVRADDHYSQKLAREVVRCIDIRPEHRVLELGAGFDRFTFHLLEHCASIVALDLSSRVLEELVAERTSRGIPESRLRAVCRDVDAIGGAELGAPFDQVVGFFFLHHLPDYRATIAQTASLLTPAGRMAFVEPNRFNPLFLFQVLACPDMTWREERGMFLLGERGIAEAFTRAGLEPRSTHRFGFFPPAILNRAPSSRRIEARLERFAPLRPLLPFLLVSAEAGRGAGADGE
jgi:2-polyprenyl-3-methyl-5-hydroxy-6-metoxy-1,4-benzoquinol methylase